MGVGLGWRYFKIKTWREKNRKIRHVFKITAFNFWTRRSKKRLEKDEENWRRRKNMETRGRKRKKRKGGRKLEEKEKRWRQEEEEGKIEGGVKWRQESYSSLVYAVLSINDVEAKKVDEWCRWSIFTYAVLEDARCRNNDTIHHVEYSFTELRYHWKPWKCARNVHGEIEYLRRCHLP